MNDIKLFGKDEVASKEAKGEKMYYSDNEVIRKTKKNRTLIYILAGALFLSVAGLGFYDYVQDKTVAESLNTVRTELSNGISNLSARVDALVARVLNLEKRVANLEQETDENASQISKTQQDVGKLQTGLEQTNADVASLQYTQKDAQGAAVLFASQFSGMEVEVANYSATTNRWEISGVAFSETASARRISTEVVNVVRTANGYDVVLMLGYKGFSFTNGILYFQMTVAVGNNGSIDGYTVVFDHG